jgi:integrase/recombinase XerD
MTHLPPDHRWPLADQKAWVEVFTDTDLLDDGGTLAHLRQASQTVLRESYLSWMAWLAVGDPEALAESPADRATLVRMRRWMEELSGLRPMSRLMRFDAVLRLLRAMEPERDWGAHRRFQSVLRHEAGSGDRSRKAGRIFDSGFLLQLGLDLAARPPEGVDTELRHAARVRTGAMIALLATLPLRSKTFAGLELGRSVLDRGGSMIVCVAGDQMKSGIPWEGEVAPVVLPVLRRYLDEARGILMRRCGEDHHWLWVGNRGAPYAPGHLSATVAKALYGLAGVSITAHLFRDAAATTLTRSSPEAARLIAPLLAHSSLETAARHYIHAGSIEAGRRYADVLTARRKAG